MAKIKFLLQGKSKTTQIYLRLSLSKNISFKRKTGYSIDFKEWSQSSGYPKTNNASNKNLKVDLKKLETFIESSLNKSNSDGIEITSLWLKETIEKHLGKSKEIETAMIPKKIANKPNKGINEINNVKIPKTSPVIPNPFEMD